MDLKKKKNLSVNVQSGERKKGEERLADTSIKEEKWVENEREKNPKYNLK